MKRRFTSLILMFIFLVLSSCGDPTAPEDLLDEARYINIFTELLVVNQLNEEQLDSVSREYLKEQVFEEYDVTQEQFERTHRYFQQQPEQQLQRLDKIEETLTEERDRLQEQLKKDRKQLSDSLAVPDTLSPPNPAEEFNPDTSQ